MSKRIKRKRLAKQQQIMATGAKLFARHGYHAARMQDIAEELGLQKGSLYYYFASKEMLLFAIIEQELETALETLQEIVTSAASPLTKLRQAVTTHLTIFHRYAEIYSIYTFEKLNTENQTAAQEIDTLGREIEQQWHQLLQSGIDSGDLKPDLDILLATKAILGMCNLSLLWFDPHGRYTLEEMADRFIDYLLNGLKQ